MGPLMLIVQASSRSWSGGPDLCLNPVEGCPAVEHTVERALEAFPESQLVVVAPGFDRGGALDGLEARFSGGRLRIHYGQDDSPLDRILAATSGLPDTAYLVRIDGVHLCFDVEAARAMLLQARRDGLDCVKLPDDFPVQLGVDIYRLGALRRLEQQLATEADRVFHIHPKFALFAQPDLFRCAHGRPPPYDEPRLRRCRERVRDIYCVPRLEVNDHRLWAGDQLSFHYELAIQHLEPHMRVLDIACGDGYGSRVLSTRVTEVHGGDIDSDNIAHARSLTREPNVHFHIEDVTRLSFPDKHFDAVVSLETIEHVDDQACLSELHRVLRPGGLVVLSTPQNRFGKVPINHAHIREYSLEEITARVERRFEIHRTIGIKAGRIVIEGDPIGSNTVVFARKPSCP